VLKRQAASIGFSQMKDLVTMKRTCFAGRDREEGELISSDRLELSADLM
jgi:hypothetical protein